MRQISTSAFLLTAMVFGGLRPCKPASDPIPDAHPELVSPYQQYDLKLKTFRPAPHCVAGVLLSVRINGGRTLQMVLDSGADLIVIGGKDARSMGLSGESGIDLVGLDSRPASVARAESLEIGPMAFRNCPVAFVKGKVADGADGVIPLKLFSDFIVSLNLPGETLGLIPYPIEGNPDVPLAGGITQHDLLLVPTVLNGARNGYVVLDTGAYCNAISRETARTLSGFPMVPEVRVAGGTGAATGQRVSSPIHFAIADRDLIADEVVALDLSDLSRHYGVEVMGVLGFPALTPFVLTIDYRSGQVKIESPGRISAQKLHQRQNRDLPSPLAFR
jgi:hypothetical protein